MFNGTKKNQCPRFPVTNFWPQFRERMAGGRDANDPINQNAENLELTRLPFFVLAVRFESVVHYLAQCFKIRPQFYEQFTSLYFQACESKSLKSHFYLVFYEILQVKFTHTLLLFITRLDSTPLGASSDSARAAVVAQQ